MARRAIFLLILAFLAPVKMEMDEDMQDLLNMLRSTCLEESGADESLVEKINKEKVIENDGKLKCYIKCVYNQMGCINEDGLIDAEATLAVMPDEARKHAEPAVRACGIIAGSDSCDSAYLTNLCFMEKNSHFFLP